MVQVTESPKDSAADEPQKAEAQEAVDGHEESLQNGKSTTASASPCSSGGRRGRSRTRSVAGTGVHSHITDQDAEGNQERKCALQRAHLFMDPCVDTSIFRGYHALVSSFGKVFHVEKRWKLIREMGSGAYGYVMCVCLVCALNCGSSRVQLSCR